MSQSLGTRQCLRPKFRLRKVATQSQISDKPRGPQVSSTLSSDPILDMTSTVTRDPHSSVQTTSSSEWVLSIPFKVRDTILRCKSSTLLKRHQDLSNLLLSVSCFLLKDSTLRLLKLKSMLLIHSSILSSGTKAAIKDLLISILETLWWWSIWKKDGLIKDLWPLLLAPLVYTGMFWRRSTQSSRSILISSSLKWREDQINSVTAKTGEQFSQLETDLLPTSTSMWVMTAATKVSKLELLFSPLSSQYAVWQSCTHSISKQELTVNKRTLIFLEFLNTSWMEWAKSNSKWRDTNKTLPKTTLPKAKRCKRKDTRSLHSPKIESGWSTPERKDMTQASMTLLERQRQNEHSK